MLNLWPSKRENWMKKSQNIAGLAQQNGFGSASFHTVMLTANSDKKAQQSLTPPVDWVDSLIGSRGLQWVVSSLPPVCLQSQFLFYGWSWKETKLECEKHFRRVTYWAPDTGGATLRVPFYELPVPSNRLYKKKLCVREIGTSYYNSNLKRVCLKFTGWPSMLCHQGRQHRRRRRRRRRRRWWGVPN